MDDATWGTTLSCECNTQTVLRQKQDQRRSKSEMVLRVFL